MSNETMRNTDYPMVQIPSGEIELRDDRTKRTWDVEIKPFLLAPYPVTTQLYCEITNKSPVSYDGNQKPIVNKSERGCGATCRRRSHPSFGIDDLGFRLAQSTKAD